MPRYVTICQVDNNDLCLMVTCQIGALLQSVCPRDLF